ncbi:fatty-acid-CoA ligase [Akanthomyces lecanii RCEF 1005]|uniref:Fatty-acid-CoA ligase n=1 Tax=Akanthomyces lecanii RCEF 1005 TaxID=1081108 RepID=A0A162KHM4_CORDF|nr:fatty-acid-CoA ligase [Akanthomyces lecanii RCEF 1005]
MALVEGKSTPKSATTSLWVALNQRAGVDPDRLALLSPKQPPNLLSELVRPWPVGGHEDEGREMKNSSSVIGDGRGTTAIRKLTSPACLLSYLLSWILPTPANSGDAPYLQWSFGELQRASIRLGAFLRRSRGVEPGATAVLFTTLSAEWTLLLSMSALNRYTAVTLPNSALRPGNQVLQDQMDELAPSIIVVATEAEARHVVDNLSTNIAVGISIEKFTNQAPDGWVSMADIAAEMASQGCHNYIDTMAALQNEPEDHGRNAFVVYTSGSTGKPKGCPLSVGYLLQALDYLATQYVPLLPTPITLVSGVNNQVRCQAMTVLSWATGNAAVMDTCEMDPESILDGLRRCRPISISLFVTAVKTLARASNYSADAVRSVRVVNLTGLTVTMAALRVAQQTFPRAQILPSYAMTEAASVVTWASWYRPPAVDKMPSWRGIAASGIVAPGSALKVVGPDGRRPVPRGEVGALHLHGKSVIENYLNPNDISDAFYTGDDGRRWFVSGDDALINAEGFLHVLGRSENTLRRDNKIVVAGTVESFLEKEYPGTSTAVVNITSRDGAIGLYAIFDDKIPATSSTEIEHCVVQKLGKAYRIEGAASLKAIGFEKWPPTISRKIDYRRLRPAIEKYITSASVQARLEKLLNRPIPIATLFEHYSVESLAAYLGGNDAVGVEQHALQPRAPPVTKDEGIAIVSMACRLSGDVDTPEKFWQLMISRI